MSDVYSDSLDLHREHRGKFAIKSKVPIKDRRDLSLAYTPGVAEVSRVIGRDKSLAREYTMKRNSVAVVTDGSAILGLGNLGPEAALPVMEGKAVLFKEFADIDAVPLCLNTQDVEEIIKIVKAIAPAFGGINLEDISAPRCFEIEQRLVDELDIPVMHDDQHGTATVVLAGLINAIKVKGIHKESVKVVINGAGAAGIAITKLLLEYGFLNILVLDSQGIIHSGRKDLTDAKSKLVKLTNQKNKTGGLVDAIDGADVFIGVSQPDILSEDMVQSMNPDPIIFAMANPQPEILPERARAAGALIVATGRSDFPNQINNVLAFPGIFRGALDNRVRRLTVPLLIAAAEALAGHIEQPSAQQILPDPLDRDVARSVAAAIKSDL